MKNLPRLLFTLMPKAARLILAPLLLLAALPRQVQAQHIPSLADPEDGTLFISAPETADFPAIRFRLDAYDSSGSFLDSLKTSDVQITEDGQIQKPQSLGKMQSGLQVILALNTSPAMAVQADGITEYQRIQKTLADWASNQKQQAASAPGGADEFSFATPTGLFLIREKDPKLLVKALNDYQPDLLHAQPGLGSLAEALDLATEPLDRPAMKRVILYVTPPLPTQANSTLPDLINRAHQLGVRVNVWQLVDKAGSPASTAKSASDPALTPLQSLAQVTGGEYRDLPQAGPLPEVEPMFRSLRWTYQVKYNSTIQKSGDHRLSVQVKRLSMTSKESTFSLVVQPPNPIFLSPPATVQRAWTAPEKNTASSLSPEQVPLQIVIEFPDQHKRALKATRLYVNDKMVQENTTEPFDRFTWPVGDIATPTRAMLRVEAVDALNLSGSSIEVPVDIVVDQPAKTSLVQHISSRGMIAIGAMASAGVVLSLVLVLTGNKRRARMKRQLTDKKRMKDPVTQPVSILQDATDKRKGKQAARVAPTNPVIPPQWNETAWPRSSSSAASARLVALDENEQPITGGAIPLALQEITFGADPRRATQVLDSPTVDGLHARLYRSPEGIFFLADQNSVAGTWINFAPTTSSGTRLEHGDLIHIGQVTFRFELTDPALIQQAEIKVIDLEA